MNLIQRLINDESGATAIEYGFGHHHGIGLAGWLARQPVL